MTPQKPTLDHAIEWRPAAIESDSFTIIRKELEALTGQPPAPETEDLLLRVIHTTADFELRDQLKVDPRIHEALPRLLAPGTVIYTDTRMVQSGINRKALETLNLSTRCLVDDPQVAADAAAQGRTRSALGVETAVKDPQIKVFVFGNAPTALFRLCQLMDEGLAAPALVIGVPVGFVGAAESKAHLLQYDVPQITLQGRKGGSNVAAAIVNALLYRLTGRTHP
ncbi:precorrin-8X methylmutase [Anoxynatronum sibiricum]|uniref:Precorrin-8X methylmutase n=1 Tax=Anoxynatronum sibiricum TaxID=210623 RepID=A0ABU9VSU9_9CLOT